MENINKHLTEDYYNTTPINNLILVKVPKEWKIEKGEKFRAASIDNTITMTISCYEKNNSENPKVDFQNSATTYFVTFDQHYKPVSEIINEGNVLLKLYNTGKTLEYHAITFVEPMMSMFVIVCFVFNSIRDLEDRDIEIFDKISQSLLYKISDLP